MWLVAMAIADDAKWSKRALCWSPTGVRAQSRPMTALFYLPPRRWWWTCCSGLAACMVQDDGFSAWRTMVLITAVVVATPLDL